LWVHGRGNIEVKARFEHVVVVGYGPHPGECVDLLQRLGARAIVGNHDLCILAKRSVSPAPLAPQNHVI
jgi:hypothetical protein